MSKINYIIGDATYPIGTVNKVIVHVCNDIGAGFVLALSRRWKEPEESYRKMKNRDLGQVEFVRVSQDIIVANMIAQHNVGYDENGEPPIRYKELRRTLKKVNDYCIITDSTMHMPRIGCGLAGGDWEYVEKIIQAVVTVPVYVYDLSIKYTKR